MGVSCRALAVYPALFPNRIVIPLIVPEPGFKTSTAVHNQDFTSCDRLVPQAHRLHIFFQPSFTCNNQKSKL